MNMNQLKYVLTVANSSSLREAAMKLYISQPALSLSISELENELGIVLFERSNRGIGLTDAGREFITYAKKVLGSMKFWRIAICRVIRTRSGFPYRHSTIILPSVPLPT